MPFRTVSFVTENCPFPFNLFILFCLFAEHGSALLIRILGLHIFREVRRGNSSNTSDKCKFGENNVFSFLIRFIGCFFFIYFYYKLVFFLNEQSFRDSNNYINQRSPMVTEVTLCGMRTFCFAFAIRKMRFFQMSSKVSLGDGDTRYRFTIFQLYLLM